MPLLIQLTPTSYEPLLEAIAWGVGAFLIVYLLGRTLVVPVVVRIVRARNERNPTLIEAVDRYARLLVVATAAVTAVRMAGYDDVLSNSAIVIAAVTLAFGIAGREVIGNLVSGLFLVVDPDFNVDDWIAWDGGEGVVETIRFRVTRIRTANNEVVTVPNTLLTTSTVTRPYSRDRVRILVRLGVSFDEDIDDVDAILREEIETIEDALSEPPPEEIVEELGDSAIRFRVQFWIEHPTRESVARVRSRYVRRIKARLHSEGIEISPASEHEISGELRIDRNGTG